MKTPLALRATSPERGGKTVRTADFLPPWGEWPKAKGGINPIADLIVLSGKEVKKKPPISERLIF